MRFNIVNTSGETWPFLAIGRLGAVAETAGADDEIPIYELVKPDGAAGIYIVNIGSAVADDGYGVGATFDEATHVRIDPDSTVVPNSRVGPIPGNWFANLGGAGFKCVNTEADLQIVPVIPTHDTRHTVVLIEDLNPDPGIYETGTVTASSSSVTTSDDLSAYDGYVVVIEGAGADGADLVTVISSSTTSTITIATAASTSVTDARLAILSTADAFIVYRDTIGRWQRVSDGASGYAKLTILNNFQQITLTANTIIDVEEKFGNWVPYDGDCDAGVWEWGEY